MMKFSLFLTASFICVRFGCACAEALRRSWIELFLAAYCTWMVKNHLNWQDLKIHANYNFVTSCEHNCVRDIYQYLLYLLVYNLNLFQISDTYIEIIMNMDPQSI